MGDGEANTKNNPWQYITKTIDSIEDYYGIQFREGFANRVVFDIVNELIEFSSHELPREIYAMCIDGKIRKGRLTSRVAVDMMATRPIIKSDKMTDELWKTMLTKTNIKYTYCFDRNTFHPEIMPDVGLYMMKYNLSYNIYKIILNDTVLLDTTGESAKIFDKYIKSERSIEAKKDIFSQQMDFNEKELKSPYFAWIYVNKLIMDDEPEYTVEFNREQLDAARDLASKLDIVYTDLIHRLKIGMSQDEAIQIGLGESEKYGFKYIEKDIRVYGPSGSSTMHGTNYNLMMYIKYLASIEDLGGIEH